MRTFPPRLAAGNADRDDVRQFLHDFQTQLRFSFHAESGFLSKTADRVLKRGYSATEAEYYALTELCHDQSQTILEADALARVSDLLMAFEAKASTG